MDGNRIELTPEVKAMLHSFGKHKDVKFTGVSGALGGSDLPNKRINLEEMGKIIQKVEAQIRPNANLSGQPSKDVFVKK